MDLPGCETTVKSINRDPSPHLEATKMAREPVDKPGRMTHFGQQQQQQPPPHLLLNHTCCSECHPAHRISGLEAVS